MELILKAAFERDVDLVLARAFYEQNGAAQLFLKNGDKILQVQHSAMELHGESDLQIIVQRNGSRHAILIEDKVDAPAQPDQYQRYCERGDRGKTENRWDEYTVFIAAPQKYLESDREAKKYPNKVSYEECLEYFEKNTDNRRQFKLSQIKQAIHKQKTGYQMIENNAVTEFWKDLQKFCEDKFPSLYMSYDGKPKGSSSTWIYFKTPVEKTWVVYKSDSGRVMLEFYSSDTSKLKEKLVPHLEDDMEFCKVGKSFGVLLHKSKWKISVKENLCDVTDVITEVLEQVARLVELVKKAEFN